MPVGEMRRGKVDIRGPPPAPGGTGGTTTADIFTLVEGTTLTYDTQQ